MQTIWGTVNGQASALPMAQLRPTDPDNDAFVLYWNTDLQALDYAPLAFDPTTGDAGFSGNVNVALGKSYSVNGTKVVEARKTGWQAPTGTTTKTTFDTSTVTTEQLAERFKALYEDLAAHGLIGV